MSVNQRFFPNEEYNARLHTIRQRMAERDLDGCLVSAPENIYYLIGLDHHGYFAYHLLIVPREGRLTLITRAMEQVTIAHQVGERAGHQASLVVPGLVPGVGEEGPQLGQ